MVTFCRGVATLRDSPTGPSYVLVKLRFEKNRQRHGRYALQQCSLLCSAFVRCFLCPLGSHNLIWRIIVDSSSNWVHTIVWQDSRAVALDISAVSSWGVVSSIVIFSNPRVVVSRPSPHLLLLQARSRSWGSRARELIGVCALTSIQILLVGGGPEEVMLELR
jgi:hypothetical protein